MSVNLPVPWSVWEQNIIVECLVTCKRPNLRTGNTCAWKVGMPHDHICVIKLNCSVLVEVKLVQPQIVIVGKSAEQMPSELPKCPKDHRQVSKNIIYVS